MDGRMDVIAILLVDTNDDDDDDDDDKDYDDDDDDDDAGCVDDDDMILGCVWRYINELSLQWRRWRWRWREVEMPTCESEALIRRSKLIAISTTDSGDPALQMDTPSRGSCWLKSYYFKKWHLDVIVTLKPNKLNNNDNWTKW